MSIRVFWLEPTGMHRTSLLRYTNADQPCPLRSNGHDARVSLGDFPEHQATPDDDDPRWAMTCACGYVFTETDHRTTGSSLVYRRGDTGEILTLSAAPVGAMWDCSWFAGTPHHRPGPDGIHLCVRTPGGTWEVDGRAGNCTRKEDDVHRCWVRHGDVRSGDIHVDKNGDTCAAGGGSILHGGYHGFLHNSHLVPC